MGRKKDSIRLTKHGIREVNMIRIQKGWKKADPRWHTKAYVSPSTLKRFIAGQPISPEKFKSICEVLGIMEWESLVDWENSDVTPLSPFLEVLNSESFTDKESSLKGIGVTGIFTSDKKLEVEMSLEHLKQLLINVKIVIKYAEELDYHNGLSVYGLFSPDQQLEIKIALEHLRQLLVTCTVTMM